MKTKNNLLAFLSFLLMLGSSIYAQNKVSYGYDINGNRKIRSTCPTCRLAHNPDNSVSTDTTIQADTAIAIKHGVNVFPNPTQDLVSLQLSNLKDNETAEVVVTDGSGKTFYTAKNLQAENQINMSTFSNGTYFVRISIGKDALVYKVIKVQ